MSKQMAFQFTQLAFREKLVELLETWKTQGQGKTHGAWIDSITPDEKERLKLKAIFIVFNRCREEGRDILTVKKVVGWRGPDGKPKDLEIQWEQKTYEP